MWPTPLLFSHRPVQVGFTAEGLAQRAFEKALDSVLEKLADEALKASVFGSALDVG